MKIARNPASPKITNFNPQEWWNGRHEGLNKIECPARNGRSRISLIKQVKVK